MIYVSAQDRSHNIRRRQAAVGTLYIDGRNLQGAHIVVNQHLAARCLLDGGNRRSENIACNNIIVFRHIRHGFCNLVRRALHAVNLCVKRTQTDNKAGYEAQHRNRYKYDYRAYAVIS